jgi:hypothetical protein
MAAERAAPMMVLTMNIIGDGPAHGNELGARCDRQEPAARHHHIKYLRQGYASFAAQEACCCIEGDESPQVTDVERYAVFVETTVSVTASIGIGKYGPLAC